MPSQKPSPHRFIAPVSATQTPSSKPKSNLRHAVSTHTSKLQFKKITPAKRSAATPARVQANDDTSKGATLHPSDSVDSSLYSYELTPRPKARKLGRVDSIEEVASSPSQIGDSHGTSGVVQSVELSGEEDADGEGDGEDEDELLFESVQRAKKRRTSPLSPQRNRAAPETPLGAASHRFRFPAAPTPLPFGPSIASHMPPTGAITTTSPAISVSISTSTRPHFLLPAPRSPSKPSAPLPEIFSPSRKAQKYIPTGLASSVQGWIIEAAQQGPGSGIVWGREREDGVRVKFRVTAIGGGDAVEERECWPGGTTFVMGETEPGMYNASRAEGFDEGQGIRTLLAGHGGARGSAGIKIRLGSIIGIKAPTWELDVSGETWTVGVDWAVLH